jgi:hypothetical protein
VTGGSLLQTDAVLDYTLFDTLGDSSSIPCLPLDNRLASLSERIYIPGHPSGGPKTLAIASTHPQNPAGVCEVDASPYAGNAPDTDIAYYCDTSDGSSGSPVLSGLTNKVVALHHFGGCLNSGVRMDLIIPQISSILGACSGGTGHWCGDTVCDSNETQCSCAQDCGTPPGAEVAGSTCSDTLDNDCDLLTDCADPDCVGDPACPTCSPVGAACSENADCCSDRCKGQGANRTCRAAACGDNSCAGDETQCSCAADCGTPPVSEVPNVTCNDGIDNDCDLLKDCLDPDCFGDPACTTCLPVGAACSLGTDCCSGRCKGQGASRTCR